MHGPYWVTPAPTAPRDVGDEALLLARVAPTLVARDRPQGARAIEDGPRPASVIVMDDGLQNAAWPRILSIALVDGKSRHRQRPGDPGRPAARAARVPARAGRRHRRQRAGRRGNGVAAWLRHRFPGRCCARPRACRRCVLAAGSARRRLGRHRLAAAFFRLCSTALGAQVAEAITFRDHQRLTEADAGRLLALAERHAGDARHHREGYRPPQAV